MSEIVYKYAVLRVYADARLAPPARVDGIQLFQVIAGEERRAIGALKATPKGAWKAAYEALPKGKPGDGTQQMGLEL